MRLSVVIPTRNGGAGLLKAVEALLSQRADFSWELLIVDSGSGDAASEALRRDGRVRFLAIEPSQFQHGRTRNLAMREAAGELVAFLTQDALPLPGWLQAWGRFMEAHPEVAGAFGAQLPHEGADPLEAFEVEAHFGSFRDGPEVMRRTADADAAPEWQRSRMHFFSNVNSCIRRSAWERIPFPEVDFGEDQAWAQRVQMAGLATGYAREAVVRHSHDYGYLELVRRRYDEARFMRREFGYALVPSFALACRHARADEANFCRQLAGVGMGEGYASRARAAGRAWAAALGRWLGTRLAGSDGWLHRRLSLLERRRAG